MGAPHRSRFRKLRTPTLSRRRFLQGGVAVLSLPLLHACGPSAAPALMPVPSPAPTPSPSPSPNPVTVVPQTASFAHGVASGDPQTDRVILWTRITPDEGTQLADATVTVEWVISKAADLSEPVAQGQFLTSPFRDYTVKPDVTGLDSYTTYYYQFSVMQADGSVVRSPLGRTKTAPKAGEADRLRFVSASCQNMTFGYFNSHAAIAQKADLDAMIFLGDYIYETGGSSQIAGRSADPAHEIISLADYRQRHAQYKRDADLQAAHRQLPWICIWDDHETTNNSYRTGADNHTEGAEGCWEERMAWAIRAYFEWMPIRDNPDMSFDGPTAAACPDAPLAGYLPEGHGKIQRIFQYGDLLDLIMLDTRLAARALQNRTTTVTPEQTILGDAQREFLLDALSHSTATWKFVGQQMTFAPIKIVPLPEDMGGTFLNEDAWDGYRFDRNAVMQHIRDQAIDNVVVLSGDTHVVTAFDLPIEPSDPSQYNPVTGEGSLAVEFSCNGVANVGIIGEFFMANNPHLKYSNLALQGYLLLDVTAERVQGEYYFTGAPQLRSATETFGRALICNVSESFLVAGLAPTAGRADAAPLAP